MKSLPRTTRQLSVTLLSLLAATVCGCQMVSYHSPSGETFSRSALGVNVSISSLSVETGTNGMRHVEMRGYQNDTSQTAGVVTEAAVKAALSSAK